MDGEFVDKPTPYCRSLIWTSYNDGGGDYRCELGLATSEKKCIHPFGEKCNFRVIKE